jgi:hypothetical protein
MSGILKKIGKVFKKVVSSKIFKVIAIAAAVYFTAGVALAAGGSAFAAGLPGITAAGQAVGLAGTGAIAATEAAVTGAAVASAANVSAGVMTGAADLAAGGLATEGIAGTIAATAAESAALAGADILGGAADGGGGAFAEAAAAPTTSSGFGGVGTDAAVSGAKTAATAGKTTADASWGSNLMTWMDKNPTVAKAAMQFGSDGLKTGIQMFSQKSQQDQADERYAQDRADYVRRSSSPTMTIPKPAVSQYATGLVNEVAGLKS